MQAIVSTFNAICNVIDIAASGSVIASGQVSIRGKTYRLGRLAWLYMTGEWPERDVIFRNGRSGDYRWENLDLSDHCSRAGRAA